MTEIAKTELGEALPQLMVSLMERRYLGDFQPGRWQLSEHRDDSARPLLREVLGLGRQRHGEDVGTAMPHVLTAGHWHGHAVVMAVHGDGRRHRIFLGGRRMAGSARGSTEDFIEAQGSLLAAHVPGLVLGRPVAMDGEGVPELSGFLRSAPALAAVTGIPSVRNGGASAAFQNLDRLISAAGRRRYALLVVAEPLAPADLDDALSRCLRLKSEIHTLVNRSVTRTAGESVTTGTSTAEADPGNVPLTVALYGLAAFCAAAGMLPAVGPLAALGRLSQVTGPVMSLAGVLPSLGGAGQRTAVQRSHSENRSTAMTEHLLDAAAEQGQALLARHIERLTAARSRGWWRTSVYVAADGEGTLETVTGALRGICSGDATVLDPMQVIRLPAWRLRSAITHGRSLALRPAAGDAGHPFGPSYDTLATCVTSDELAVLFSLPRRDVPGLPMRDVGEFALAVPPPTERSVRLGRLLDSAGGQHEPVTVTAEALNRHVFITGMTGYGKTTTAKNLLVQAYTRLEVPFLVIEPVKAEYRALASHPDLRGRLKVFSVGNDGGLPLRLNPFVPVGSVPLARHIDLLKAVFNAAFPMFAGMPYVLEEAMLEVYAERGWNLHTSANDVLGPRPSAEDRDALVPSIGDLHDKIEEVLDRKRYGREVHQNMGAALRSRLRSLMVGTKGMALDTRRAIPAHVLFDGPAVIELRNLGDDEEKAFVMALLLCQLYEYAESRQGGASGERLRHLTLIEEAHRLLRSGRGVVGMETPDSQAKAVNMFTDMLAEMRAYGEGFIVADQVPTKLAPETVKNSNVKIIHRLVSAEDRAVVAAALGLTDAQNRHLATLPPGEAVVHDERIGSAVLVRMTDAERRAAGRAGNGSPGGADAGPGGDAVVRAAAEPAGTGAAHAEPLPGPVSRRPDLSYLHRNGGCRYCPDPCSFLWRTEPAADAAFEPFFVRVLLSDAEQAWAEWARQREAYDAEALYCTVTQAAHRWLGRFLADREAAAPHGNVPAPDRNNGVPTGLGEAAGGRGGGSAGGAAGRWLRQDRGAREFARLVAHWRTADSLDAAARTRFAHAQSALRALVADPPGRESPGCASCPARCLVLSFVAPHLPAVREQVVGRVTALLSAEAKVRSIRKLGPQLAPGWRLVPPGAERDAVLHCLVTTATAGTADEAAGDVLPLLPDQDG